ncbi:MAG: hypothetical protein KF802_08880 [Bdellovibrionaceae bacterium]|nr:hypothetical protein [Pseudobdellovibrionaceae bacterium]
MSKEKKDIPLWAKTGHARPVTRRDFLAAGLIPFAASALLPSWMSLFLASPEAQAQSALNCSSGNSAWIPFITLNLAGGAAMMSNYLPMNAAGAPIASYSKMGLGNKDVPIAREFGNVPFAGEMNGQLLSRFLDGVRATAAASLSNTAFMGLCVRSRDDSAENRFDVSGMAHVAGLAGSRLPNLGSNDSLSGFDQLPAVVAPPSPLVIRSFNDAANALGFSASLGTALTQPQREKVAKLVSSLNSSQARKLASFEGGDVLQNLVSCAGIKNEDLIRQGSAAVDPRQNAAIAQLWNINANTGANNRDLVFATMVYNAVSGQSGSANLQLGGFDYHDNSRNTGNTRDREAGLLVGRILETARLLNRPVFLYVTSDGAVSSAESETDRLAPWTSDRGSAGGSYILVYHPAGRIVTTHYQIGSFTDGQAADDKFVIGNNPELAAQAVFANYLQLNRRMDLFERIAGRGLDSKGLSEVIKIA